MSITSLSDGLPGYAADLRANLYSLSADTHLTDKQKWGAFLACAYATGERHLIAAFENEAQSRLTPDAIVAVKQAVAMMAMNTVYFGAIHLLHNHDYRAAPAELSMAALTSHGIDRVDFELWALAIAALSGSAASLNAHEAELHKRNVPMEAVLAVLRIAAVVRATAVIFPIEVSSHA